MRCCDPYIEHHQRGYILDRNRFCLCRNDHSSCGTNYDDPRVFFRICFYALALTNKVESALIFNNFNVPFRKTNDCGYIKLSDVNVLLKK